MRLYSAAEAIRPAWDHTRSLLSVDRRWRRVFKVCLVAVGAQLGGGLNGSFNRGSGSHGLPGGASAALLMFGLVVAVFGLLFSVAMLYLGSRLQFVLFDLVLLRDDRVAPAWRRHGLHTWRWIGIKLLVAVVLLLAFSPLLVPLGIALVHVFHAAGMHASGSSHGAVDWSVVRAAAVLILEALALFVVFAALFRLFTTVALPGLALENLTFGNTFERAWMLFREEVTAMLGFAALQLLVNFAIGLLAVVCWVISALVVAAPVALVGWLLWTALHASAGGLVLLGTAGALAACVFAAWLLLSYVLFAGTALIFGQAYGLYFMGGRYPLLGQYLEPEPAPRLGFRD